MSFGLGMGLSLTEGGAAAGWTPAKIGGVTLWLRSDLGIALDGSNRLQAWTDQIHGYAFTQGTAANRPNYNASGGPNGTPRVSGASNNAWVALSQSIALTGCTCIVIAKVTTVANPNAGYFCAADSGNDFNSPNGAIFRCKGSTGGLAGYAGTFIDSTVSFDVFHSFRVDVPAGTSPTVTMSADGSVLTTFAPASGNITPTIWSVGSRIATGAAGNTPFDGDICEIILTNGKMAAGDLSLTSTYTTARYGLAA